MKAFILFLITAICSIGFLVQYSAAGGSMDPWTIKQIYRFLGGCFVLLCVSCVKLRYWFTFAYPIYCFVLVFLIAVELSGFVGMGARRWLDLGFFNFQPSELMRVALILALARYFHDLPFEMVKKNKSLIMPGLFILIPTLLVCRQPDLGTALLLLGSGVCILFASGVQIWKFVLCFLGMCGCAPVFWGLLHDYQKKRILTFLNPESDPLKSGYHVIQSKISIGSGGITGKGFLKGTQSHLDFLPEKQTDFIFSMFCEEFGFIGGCCLISLYIVLILSNLFIAWNAANVFGRLLALGLTFAFFLYAFINIGMVSGVLPVVGVPLPFVSYGGSALIVLLLAQGLIFSVYRAQKKNIF